MNLTSQRSCRLLAPILHAVLDGKELDAYQRAALRLLADNMEQGAEDGVEQLAAQLARIASDSDPTIAAKIHRYLIGNVRALL